MLLILYMHLILFLNVTPWEKKNQIKFAFVLTLYESVYSDFYLPLLEKQRANCSSFSVKQQE